MGKIKPFVFYIILTLIFINVVSGGYAQKLDYKIVWKGDSIGFLSANVERENDFEKFIIESHASFWILKRFNLEYFYESHYEKDIFTYGITASSLNDKPRSKSRISKSDSGYDIVIDGELSKLEARDISRSITAVYHKPPLLATQIFSERYGEYCKWEPVSENQFELTKPNGFKNIYEYQDGICQKVTVENRFATFYFELIGQD